jgi:hypothetical protein
MTNHEVCGRIENLMEIREETIRLCGSANDVLVVDISMEYECLCLNLEETNIADVINIQK